jgi:translation elongation factor EF-Tu-like GTPase
MFRMTVEDVFAIRGRGVMTTGRVEAGQLRVGDNVGLVFADVERSQLSPNDVLTSPTVS